MSQPTKVFVLVLDGQQRDALAFAQRRYPQCELVWLTKAELREGNWKSQLRELRRLRGKALLIFTDSLESLREPVLLKWTVLVHRCRETVLADASGSQEVTSKAGLLRLLPQTLIAALSDLVVFALTGVVLQLFRVRLRFGRELRPRTSPLDVAFLYPSRGGLNTPGGALTHATGFLAGLAQEGARAAVFSGQRLEVGCAAFNIPGSRRLHLSREAASLAYNIRFMVAVRRLLVKSGARLLYQRHGRFLFAGALLSRWLRIPLVLEYNGSEDWIAKHWDPAHFAPWLRLCEQVSVQAASLIVVVSNPLKQQLMQAGVPAEQILVNPNAVEPEWFRPGCGGAKLREDLGVRSEDVLVGFVGTFSYWHGVSVLTQAVRLLLENRPPTGGRLKFLLVGDGLLAPQVRSALEAHVHQQSVFFTGTIPHNSVRTYLDAADILVSPHVPMPDGRPFFGSPTKLFEYMAMGKAIAASALDQIAEVLEHGRTALLVKPGDAGELAEAIRRLAADAQLRAELGRNAREAALARHTWRQNAKRVLAHYGDSGRIQAQTSYSTVAALGLPSRSANLGEQNW